MYLGRVGGLRFSRSRRSQPPAVEAPLPVSQKGPGISQNTSWRSESHTSVFFLALGFQKTPKLVLLNQIIYIEGPKVGIFQILVRYSL